MRTLAGIIFAALLAAPALSVAGDQAANPAPKPMSFVPHSNSGQHVYGSPIGKPIVGHARNHPKQAPKKPPTAVSSRAQHKHR